MKPVHENFINEIPEPRPFMKQCADSYHEIIHLLRNTKILPLENYPLYGMLSAFQTQLLYVPMQVVRDQNDPCLYAGGQHGDNTDSSDSVIQGLYTDYVLAGPFDTDYQYSKFDSNGCQ